MGNAPETRYAKTDDGLRIAYQTLGEGPTDVVMVPSAHCVDMMWDEPSFAHVLYRFARLGRLIALDYRGWGGSDPVPLGALPTPETWMEDTRVVLDTLGSTAAHIVCHAGSGFLGMLFAATYPERTKSLTLIGASARILRGDDYPIGIPADLVARFAEREKQIWGTPAHAAVWAPSRADDERFRHWSGRFERAAASPSTHDAMFRWVVSLDLRAVLPAIRVPTLVIHREASQMISVDHGRYLADHIRDATLAVLPGADFWFFTERADDLVDRIEEFITGVRPEGEPDRSLATVLFTDIVSSTEHAARLGDQSWTQILNQHDALVASELDRYRGRKVNPTGDGFLATFDGPSRAVKCAQAICEAIPALGVEVRAGVHTGEVIVRGNDIGGIAVHIGQRVSSLANGGEVLVTRTVTDLVAGSGLQFEDRGEHQLKGVPGTWPLFALTT